MKKAISIGLAVLVCFMAFALPLAQPAQAVVATATVTIVGAVVAFLALSGIVISSAGMDKEEFTNWVWGKLQTWANSLGNPIEHLLPTSMIGVTASGMLTLASGITSNMESFMDWFKTDQGIQAGGNTVNVQLSVPLEMTSSFQRACTFSDGSFYEVKQDNLPNYKSWCVYLKRENGYQGPAIFSLYQVNISMHRRLYNRNGTYNDYYQNNETLDRYDGTFYVYYNVGPSLPNAEAEAHGTVTSNMPVYEGVQSASAAIRAYIDAYNINRTKEINLKPASTIESPIVNNGEVIQIGVGAAAGSGVAEVTEKVIANAVADEVGQISEVVEEYPSYVVNAPVAVTGLKDVFPFCIPFDIYSLLTVLAAEPEAPVVTWRFYVPGVVDETIELDFSQFDTVAQILRTIELLAFIVGLAFVTRKLIRG